MPYFTVGTPVSIIARPAGMASNGAGPYYPSTPLDDNGNAAVITINGTNYYGIYFSSDHGATGAEASTGIYLYVCLVGNDVTNPSNWVAIDSIAAASTTNPILANGTSGVDNQPETPCVRYVNGTFYMTEHEDLGSSSQRTYLWSSANGYSGWTKIGLSQPEAASDVMAFQHNGYKRWMRNHHFTGLPYKYIAQSLGFWASSGSGEDGDFYNTRILGSNDPTVAEGWTHIRYRVDGQEPATFDGLTVTHRPLPIEGPMSGFKRASDGRIIGLCSIVEAAAGSGARVSVLAEIAYDRNFRYASQPRAILTKGTDDANEQGQPEVVTFNGTQYVIYQAANASNVNNVAIATLTFDPAGESLDAWPLRNTIKETDFRSLSALPTGMAKHTNTTVTFDGTTGLTVSTPSAGKAFVKLGASFVPAYFDVVDILFDGLTCSDGATNTMTLGFVTGDETTNDEFSDATENIQAFTVGSGGAKIGEKTAAGSNTYSTPSSTTGHGFGRANTTGANQPKQVGLRWWPHRAKIAWIGEDGNTAHTEVLTRVHTLTTPHVPAIASVSSSGVATTTFRKVTVSMASADFARTEVTRNNIPTIGSKLIKVA